MTEAIHPAPQGFTDEQLAADPILRYFHFAHLPASLQVTSNTVSESLRQITSPR